MGLGQLEVEFLLNEHRYRPITGDVLAIGRQAIELTPGKTMDLLKLYGIAPLAESFEFDKINKHHSSTDEWINDHSLFRSFSDCRLFSADLSAYEGADFVFNVCEEVPDDLVGRFDFVIDGGSLDNVFDPARMLRNMSKMLKPGGRAFTFAWSNSYASAYLKITPDWIMDYYAANEFADCKVYVAKHPSIQKGEKVLAIWHFDPAMKNLRDVGAVRALKVLARPDRPAHIEDEGRLQTFCIAEKSDNSTNDRVPVQWQYRLSSEPYRTSISRFRSSPRPIFASPTSNRGPIRLPPISSHGTLSPVAAWG
jgi:SAM-dependent methyltransferase